jgi:hypothetical protein
MDPIAAAALDWTRVLLDAAPKLYELWRALGSRDALLAALDSALETARAKTDRDLEAKHRP